MLVSISSPFYLEWFPFLGPYDRVCSVIRTKLQSLTLLFSKKNEIMYSELYFEHYLTICFNTKSCMSTINEHIARRWIEISKIEMFFR